MKKNRMRLTDAEAEVLGFASKGKYQDKTNGKYYLSKKQVKALEEIRGVAEKTVNHTAKILTMDIETAPTQAFVWSKWGQNINDNQIQSDWFMLTWAAKELNGDSFGAKLTPEEAIEENDKRITEALWKTLDDADMIIGHNFDRFDKKKINTRFLLHGLPLPSSYVIIDTVKVARTHFGFHSNKLDFIAQQLGVGQKLEHEGMEMWRKCMAGEAESLDKMFAYNLVDVEINEKVYKKLLPYITSHPNLNNFSAIEGVICANCGATEDKFESIGEFHTNANSYEEARCTCCESRLKYNKKKTKVTSITR